MFAVTFLYYMRCESYHEVSLTTSGQSISSCIRFIFFFFTAIRMDKVWKSKEKAQMTNLQEGQLHAAQLEDGPLFGPMFVGMS